MAVMVEVDARRAGDIDGILRDVKLTGKVREQGRPALIMNAPQTDDELWRYVRDTWGIELVREVHPDCINKGHEAPFTAFASAYFARDETALWIGSRGLAGKTYLMALLALPETTTLGAGVALIGGSLDQSKLAYEYTTSFWELASAPRHLLIGEPTTRELKLTNGGNEYVHAASSKSARGGHRPRLRLDEADEFDLNKNDPDMIKVLDDAMGQPMEQRGLHPQTVISSTHHYAKGAVTVLLKRIAEGELDAHKYTWCYKESLRRRSDATGEMIGWLSQAEVRRMRGRMRKKQFEVEVELQEPSVEGRVIDSDAVNNMFNPAYNRVLLPPGTRQGIRGEYIEVPCCGEYLKTLTPCLSHTYVTGCDWGRKRDLTAIVTYRTDTATGQWWLVAWWSDHKMPWPLLTEHLNQRVRRFPGRAAHDATGLGDVVDSMITVSVDPVILGGGQSGVRTKLFNDYIMAIEQDGLTGVRVEAAWYSHYYLTKNDLWGSGHPPDDFVAGALAWGLRSELIDPGLQIGGPVGPSVVEGLR